MVGRLGGDRDDDRLDLAAEYVQDDARLGVGPEQGPGVGDERPAGAVLLADVGVAVEDVVEEVGVLELAELVPLVAVDPGDPLAGQLDRPERVVVRPADLLDRGDELEPVAVPVAEHEVRRDGLEQPDGVGRLDVAAVEDQLDAVLQQQADRLGDGLAAVVGVADHADPHVNPPRSGCRPGKIAPPPHPGRSTTSLP